jgi:trk system potassium uptake protein TrkH
MRLSILDRAIFLQLFVIISLSMIIPSIVAFAEKDYFVGRTFLYSSLAGVFVFLLISIALSNIPKTQNNFDKLVSFILSYLFLPVFMAMPIVLCFDYVSFLDGWLEMVSAFSTTGLNITPVRTSDGSAFQLWIAMISWIGGIFFWIGAVSILLPLNISKFEIGVTDFPNGLANEVHKSSDPVINYARQLIPIYIAITISLWLLLTLSGVPAFKAVLMSMFVISTSGFEVTSYNATNIFIVEGIILLFFVFALSKSLYIRDINEIQKFRIFKDPEIRLALIIILGVTVLIFANSFIVLISENAEVNIVFLFKHLWGIFFTVTSYLVTMGNESNVWFKDLHSPTAEMTVVALMGLTIIGGGVATTAGGVKLLRVYILYRNAAQEVDMMLHPNSIPSKKGKGLISDNKSNRLMAWIFFMLFMAALAFFTFTFSMLFDDIGPGLALSVSALTTTGPLFVNAGYELLITDINRIFKFLLGIAMILGRLEILVIVALISPSVWSK